jgi:hypothetical protein
VFDFRATLLVERAQPLARGGALLERASERLGVRRDGGMGTWRERTFLVKLDDEHVGDHGFEWLGDDLEFHREHLLGNRIRRGIECDGAMKSRRGLTGRAGKMRCLLSH